MRITEKFQKKVMLYMILCFELSVNSVMFFFFSFFFTNLLLIERSRAFDSFNIFSSSLRQSSGGRGVATQNLKGMVFELF